MNRPFPEWPDQAERERRAAKARRWTLYLAGIAAVALLASAFMSGCGGRGPCRDRYGRFEKCPSKKVLAAWDDFGKKASDLDSEAARKARDMALLAEMTENLRAVERKAAKQRAEWDAEYLRIHGHGEPVGADHDGKDFYCRDAEGRRWLSQGECD